MEGLTWGALGAVFVLLTSICSIASFYFGRRKAATDEAEEEGGLKTDLYYIKETMRDTSKSLDALSTKLDAQSKQREDDYRSLLVKFTELSTKHDSVANRLHKVEKEIAQYHHNG